MHEDAYIIFWTDNSTMINCDLKADNGCGDFTCYFSFENTTKIHFKSTFPLTQTVSIPADNESFSNGIYQFLCKSFFCSIKKNLSFSYLLKCCVCFIYLFKSDFRCSFEMCVCGVNASARVGSRFFSCKKSDTQKLLNYFSFFHQPYLSLLFIYFVPMKRKIRYFFLYKRRRRRLVDRSLNTFQQ